MIQFLRELSPSETLLHSVCNMVFWPPIVLTPKLCLPQSRLSQSTASNVFIFFSQSQWLARCSPHGISLEQALLPACICAWLSTASWISVSYTALSLFFVCYLLIPRRKLHSVYPSLLSSNFPPALSGSHGNSLTSLVLHLCETFLLPFFERHSLE